MAKTKLRKLYKIKVHKNRWLIWAIAYVVIVTLALFGYVKVSDLNFDTQMTGNTYQPLHSYNDARLGFGVRYPADWSIGVDSNSSVTFFPSEINLDGVTISVVDPVSEKFIRQDLKIRKESSTFVDGSIGRKIINDIGDNHAETVVLALKDHKLYVIRGSDNLVSKVLLTFRF